jgi:hypothetical protein
VAVRKLEGVDSVAVSLDSGLAVIRFKPGNHVTVQQVREAIQRNGFTPKAAEVRVRGTLVERDGEFALSLTGSEQVFILAESRGAADVLNRLRSIRPGTVLAIEGVLPETGKDAALPTLQVRRLTTTP